LAAISRRADQAFRKSVSLRSWLLHRRTDVRLSRVNGADRHLRCGVRHRQLRSGLDIQGGLFAGGLFRGRGRSALGDGVGFGEAHIGELERRGIRLRQGQSRP
jgi:hypothetical protein